MGDASVSERVARVLPSLYALTAVEAFPILALSLVRQLVGGDKGTYTEVDRQSGDFRALVDPQPTELRDLAQARIAYMHQHPVLVEILRRPTTDARLISDLLTRREFHRLDLYGEFFARLGVEDQLTVLVSHPSSPHLAGLSVERDRASFDDRERRLLESFAPHLTVARSNAMRFSQAIAGQRPDDRTDAPRLERLTERQREILAQLASGRTNAQIAQTLDISTGTTRKHVEHILRRLEVSTRTAAAVMHITSSTARANPPWTASIPSMLHHS